MRKFLLVFLMVLAPLQITWAAVGSYCQHEQGNAAQHFGHHVHQHQAGNPDATQDQSPSPSSHDEDCGYCHFSSTPLAPAFVLAMPLNSNHLLVSPLLPYLSRIESGLDRPNWQHAV